MTTPFKTLQDQLTLPLFGAPMFLISGPKLVKAQCLAGIIGSFPALNARPQSELKEWIHDIRDSLAIEKANNPSQKIAPFAVNLVALSSNTRYEADLQTCLDEQVPIIITSMKAPENLSDKMKAYGGLHFHDVTTVAHAKKAIASGVDGLILVCAGAGGHAGSLNPFAFVKEVRSFYKGSIVLAGAMSTGSDIKAAQTIGADMAYMGTRFIATHEAQADNAYKEMILDASSEDIVQSDALTGVKANFLKQSLSKAGLLNRRFGKLCRWLCCYKLKKQKRWKDVWSAGQGVGSIHEIKSVKELVTELSS